MGDSTGMGAAAQRLHSSAPRRARSGPLGAVSLLVIALACAATLPWTLGWLNPGTIPPYRAQRLTARHLPPFWSPHTADERERRRAAAEEISQERRGEDTPGSPTEREILDAAPRFWLGSDALGRDLLARCLAGGAISLGIGLSAAMLTVVIGTVYGATAGYAGGRVDALLMRVVDILFGLPSILLVVLLAVAVDALTTRWAGVAGASGPTLGPGALAVINLVTLLAAIGGVSWLSMSRVVRGQVLSLRAQPFMEAARAIGVSPLRQMFGHMLPNLAGVIIVYATLATPQAILQESFLSFLGIGVRPPLPSWGGLVAEGLSELNLVRPRWWLLAFPAALLGVTLLALNFTGEWLRESMDPRRAGARAAP